MSSIVIRWATANDDLYKMASCLYLTDPYIYPGAFGTDIHKAAQAIAKLMSLEGGLFDVHNFVVACLDGEVCGILLCNSGGLHWDINKKLNVVKEYIECVDNFVYVSKQYFGPEAKAGKTNQIEIVACCVFPEYRGRGIGENMLTWLIQAQPDKLFVLDVLADNTSAVALYKKVGFCIEEKYKGFHMEESMRPDCYRMVREIVSRRISQLDPALNDRGSRRGDL